MNEAQVRRPKNLDVDLDLLHPAALLNETHPLHRNLVVNQFNRINSEIRRK